MAVGDIISIALEYRANNQVCVNVLHYKVSRESTLENDAENLAKGFVDTLVPLFKACQSQECEIIRVRGKRIFPNAILAEYIAGAGGFGTQNGKVKDGQSAVVLTQRTSLAGRSYRGRCYLGGLSGDTMVDGKWDSPFNDPLDPLMTGLQTQLLGRVTDPPSTVAIGDPCVFSRKLQSGSRIVNVTSDRILRSQRRRQIGNGK